VHLRFASISTEPLDHSYSAVEVGLDYLRRVDDGRWRCKDCGGRPSAYDGCCSGSVRFNRVAGRFALMTDPTARAMDVLTDAHVAGPFHEENLFRLVVCRMAALS